MSFHIFLQVMSIAYMYIGSSTLKDGLSLKIKNLDIHLYFIATKYSWNNSLVEDIDNLILSYSLFIKYWNRQK